MAHPYLALRPTRNRLVSHYVVAGSKNPLPLGMGSVKEGFIQMTIILVIMGLFDRFFIDWYWVGHTKAWLIPGTEDLRPYIPAKVLVRKWIGTLVAYPLMALLMAKIMTFIV